MTGRGNRESQRKRNQGQEGKAQDKGVNLIEIIQMVGEGRRKKNKKIFF